MKNIKQTKKEADIEQMSQTEFKEEFGFRKIEVVFYKSCSLCRNSRIVKNPSKMVKIDLLVCSLIEPAFVVEASTVCDAFK